MPNRRFISLKWQIFAITGVVTAGVLVAMINYWQIAIDRATEMSREEDSKMISSLVDALYLQWRTDKSKSLEMVAADQRIRLALGEGGLKSEVENILSDLSFTTGASMIHARSGKTRDTYTYSIPDSTSVSQLPKLDIESPDYEVECKAAHTCQEVLTVPVLYRGETAGTVTAAFPFGDFYSMIKTSRFPATIMVVSEQDRLPAGWRRIPVRSMNIPTGFYLAGSAPPQGHLVIIQFALKTAGLWGGVVFVMMQIMLIMLLYKRFSYVKILESGISMMLRGKTDPLKAHLTRERRWHVVDELDRIGETLVKTGEELSQLRESEAQSAEDRARLKAAEYMADERKQMLAKFVQAEEEMRQTLARDLHDEVGARLVSMRVDAAMIKRSEVIPPDIADRASRIERNCLHLHNFLTTSIERLCPPVIESLGLPGSIRGLIEEWASSLDGRTTFEVDLNGDLDSLPTAQSTAAYRIVQEAVTNIAKYAEADKVNIQVSRKPSPTSSDAVVIEIVDNGKGFEMTAKPKGGGRGLQGIEDRAKGFGGAFMIDSHPGGGTRLRCCLPIVPDKPVFDI